MSFSAVVFDLDGTLLDSLADIADSANGVLAGFGFPTHGYDAYRFFVGDGVAVLFSRCLPAEARSPEMIAACVASFRDAYGLRWNRFTRPYDGVAELLTELSRRNFRLAVLSNKPHEFTQQCVDELLSEFRFDAVLGQKEDVPCKPDPKGALRIAATINVEPAKCLYLGDTAIDIRTAQRAGMYPVGALWGFRPGQELEDAGAAVLIADPRELLTLC